MKKYLAALFLVALSAVAWAQSNPGFVPGQVPTAAQWNSYFTGKQNTLGYAPLNPANNLSDVNSTSTALANLAGAVPIPVANGGTGASTTSTAAAALGVNAIVQTSTQNGLAFYSQTGTIGGLLAGTNGQIPIGRTGNSPTLATLTAGYGVSTTNGSGSITQAIALNSLSVSLTSDVTLSNTSTYFDGPSVAQGSVGTWSVSGTVTVNDTSGSATPFNAKLWDGTTVIASTRQLSSNGTAVSISLSGVLASPAGNLRISVEDVTATTGAIKFNVSGNSKDSTITAVRIQ